MLTMEQEKNVKCYKYYEFMFTKLSKYIKNKIIYKSLEILLSPVIYYKKKNGWASQYIIVFQKDS